MANTINHLFCQQSRTPLSKLHRPFFSTGSRPLSTTATLCRISDRFKMQFRLPGRTNSALSAGVVATPNDPMIPRDKYFKPKGIPQGAAMTMMLAGRPPNIYETSTKAFRLVASPWAPDEYPRDHNGLRIRDYRVAILATKKRYSKKVYHRWRAVRILRTAASLVLPDKGLKRCDYMFHAKAEMRMMHRDEVFLMVEQALVQIKLKVDVQNRLYKNLWHRPNPALRAKHAPAPGYSADSFEAFPSSSSSSSSSSAKKRILEDVDPSRQPVPMDYCVSHIIQEMKEAADTERYHNSDTEKSQRNVTQTPSLEKKH